MRGAISAPILERTPTLLGPNFAANGSERDTGGGYVQRPARLRPSRGRVNRFKTCLRHKEVGQPSVCNTIGWVVAMARCLCHLAASTFRSPRCGYAGSAVLLRPCVLALRGRQRFEPRARPAREAVLHRCSGAACSSRPCGWRPWSAISASRPQRPTTSAALFPAVVGRGGQLRARVPKSTKLGHNRSTFGQVAQTPLEGSR